MQMQLHREQWTNRETYAQAKNIAEQQISTLQAKTAGMTLVENLQAGIFYTATSMPNIIPKERYFIIQQTGREKKENSQHQQTKQPSFVSPFNVTYVFV